MRRYGDLRQILSVSLFVIISAFQSVSLAAAKPVILDNGKSGTSSSGTWTTSIGAKYYGTKSQYSKQSGASYTYKFNLAAPGEYQVFARWTVWSDRGTSVPYDISHVGGTSTIKVNQRQNGGQWRQLGTTWHFGSTATIKLRSLGNGATTNADAIKLVPVSGNTAPVVTTIGNHSVNAGDTLRFNVSATDSDGASPVLSAENLPPNAVFIDNNNGTGIFTWPTIPSDTGSYNVTFIATGTSDPTVTGRKTVSISVVDNAIAATLDPVILDNGKSGTSSSGTWTTSIGAKYYGTKSQYSKQSGASYTYKFNLAAPGEYQVFARWTVWSDRGTSVPYDISHVGGTSTIKVNQRQNGGQWRQLGTTWHFGSTATIKLRSLGNGATTNADAIKLVPVNGNIIDPPPNSVDIVYYNNFDNENIGTTYTDQHLRNNWQVPYGGQSRDAKVVANPANLSGNSLSVLFRANEYGSNHGVSWRSDIGSHEELYLAYDVMFENGYDFRLGGKLPGLGGGDQTVANGGYGPPKGNDGWSGRLMWLTQESDYPVDGSVINYMYLPTNGGAYGNHYKWNVGGQRAFTTGKWYALEIRYKMNTPGKSNGILQGWINGELVMDKRSVIYRTVQSLKINYLIFNTFHGGGAPAWAPSHNQHLFFDNVTLSTQPITH